ARAAKWLFGERDPDPDPQRSWDMDPLPAEYPSVEDARQRRIENIWSGEQRDNITNETRMSYEPVDTLNSRYKSGALHKNPPEPQPIGWDTADQIMRGKMAADQSAVGAL